MRTDADVIGVPTAPASARRPRMLLRFALTFGLLMLIGNVLLALRWTEGGIIEPWTRVNATAAAGLTRLLGMEATASGSNLSSGGVTLSVRNGCDGIHAALILVAAIAAFPAPLSRRLIGIVAGALIIFGLNVVRLANLLVVAVHLPGRLEFFHIYVWQILIGVLAVGLFLMWGAFFARRGWVVP